MAALRVLMVAAEAYPLIKTGGLADVCGALPAALAGLGVDARLLLPGYPAVLEGLEAARRQAEVPDLFGGAASLVAGRLPNGTPAIAIDAPHLYARAGNPYLGPDRRDWPDNHRRFAALGWVAARSAELLSDGGTAWRAEVVHAHDWQAGLAPAYLALAEAPRPRTVMTVHNLAFQGLFPAEHLAALRLPPAAFTYEGVEFHGRIGFLKAGLAYADRITTVSPTYAREIRGFEQGCGLEGLLAWRADDLVGILNGLDTAVWDPARDPALARPYGPRSLARKAANKAALQHSLGLAEAPARPLFGVVSRLTRQKGMDLLAPLLGRLSALGGQLALLGSGEGDLEAAFRAAAAQHPGDIAVRIGYDEALAHLIQGGADALLVPSRFEPCGLTQLAALRYGTLPVVARVGGLADSVIDANAAALADGVATGLVFAPTTAAALADALERAVALYRQPPAWRAVQRRAMSREVGWARAAAEYKALYAALTDARAAPAA